MPQPEDELLDLKAECGTYAVGPEWHKLKRHLLTTGGVAGSRHQHKGNFMIPQRGRFVVETVQLTFGLRHKVVPGRNYVV